MSEGEKVSHWKSLAADLGAEAKLPAPVRAPAPQTAVAPPKKKAEAPARPERPRSNWAKLAAALGAAPSPALQKPPPADRPQEAADRLQPVRGQEPAGAAEVHQTASAQGTRQGDELAAAGSATSARKSGRRRRRRGDRKPAESLAAGEAAADGAPGDVVGDAQDLVENGSQAAEQQKRRPRRRRRRRGGLKSGEPPAEPVGQPQDQDPLAPRAESPHAAGEADGDGAEPGDVSGADEDSDSDDLKPSHRAIPTWEEAVGVIIASNMEARAKNPRSASSTARGRGWGNRGRRKPPG